MRRYYDLPEKPWRWCPRCAALVRHRPDHRNRLRCVSCRARYEMGKERDAYVP